MFALCNTPIKVLHTLFANHTDYVDQFTTDTNSPQLHTAGIDCHCQSNVVVSPYTYVGSFVINENVSFFTATKSCSIVTIPFLRNITSGLRGPPVSIG